MVILYSFFLMIIGLVLLFSALTILFYLTMIIEKEGEAGVKGGDFILEKSFLNEADDGETTAAILAAILAYTKKRYSIQPSAISNQ